MIYNRTAILCRRGIAWGKFALLGFYCGSAGLYSWGQAQTPVISAQQKKKASTTDQFFLDLDILSRRLGVAFVAEGEPFPTNKEAVPTLKANLSQEEAVQEVADYFDYNASQQGNVYILTKRYTNPDDLPEVSPDECKAGLKAISKILTPFNPKIPLPTIAGDPEAIIAHMLNAEQLEKLSKNGLPIVDLTPSQREEVWKIARKFYLQSQADKIDTTYDYLENRNPVDPVFHWQTLMEVHAFGYDTRSVHQNKMVFIPVSDSNRIGALPDGSVVIMKLSSTRNGITTPLPDPTDPATLSEQTRLFLDDKGKSSHTNSISEAISALNERAVNHLTYKVDPMYATKRVTLVGTDKLAAEVLMHSFASVYSLRVVHSEDNSIVLTYPLPVEVKKISDLGRSLKSAIPAPIYHALQSQSLTTVRETKGVEKPVLLVDYEIKGAAIRKSALKMFRYLAEPAVKSRPEEKLALSQFEERARNTFALAYTANNFSQACWLADRPAPPYIADFDHITLTGGYYRNPQGAERFSLFFSFTDPKSGENYQGVGFYDVIPAAVP